MIDNLLEMRIKAKELLVCDMERIEEIDCPDIDAVYFRNTDRGGGALIISRSGEMLFFDPFIVDYDEHVKRFSEGERTKF